MTQAGLVRGHRPFLAALLAMYVAKQIVFALVFPPFTGHDEVAHYEYLRVLASEGRPPSLLTHTLPSDLYKYAPFALQWRDEDRNSAPLYTAVHPPLYYMAVLPIYSAWDGASPVTRQYLLRLAAIPFGLATVWLAWLTVRALFPEDSLLLLGVPLLIAFQPQISYEAAMVNNDICAIALFSWALYLMVLTIRDGSATASALLTGFVLGLGLLAKSTALIGLPLAVVAQWLASGTASRGTRLRASVLVTAVAFLIASPWYAFLYHTYGNFTGLSQLAFLQTGLTRHDATFLELLLSGDFLVQRWRETWGEFGWRLIPLDGWLLALLAVIALAAVLGLIAAALTSIRDGETDSSALPISGWRGRAVLLLVLTCLLSYAAIVQFGTQFVLTQARYGFAAANAAAILVMLGLRAWVRPAWYAHAQTALVAGAFATNVIIFTAYVVPYWYFRS
jgi:4-amino-4-deoxy-L-arabinose transferase-like glycosyltransferase